MEFYMDELPKYYCLDILVYIEKGRTQLNRDIDSVIEGNVYPLQENRMSRE